MDRATFRRLLFRGHGRALLYLRRHPTDRFDDLILEACVRDTRYDGDVVDGCGPYLLEVVEQTPNKDGILSQVWRELAVSEPSRSQGQMLQMASLCAKRGSLEALQTLIDVTERNCRNGLLEYAEEFVRGHGEEGYRQVLAAVPEPSGELQNDFDLHWLHEQARKELDAEIADAILANLALANSNVAAVAEAVARQTAREAAPRPEPTEPNEPATFESMIENAGVRPLFWYRRWGREAAPDALLAAARELESATDVKVIHRLLNVFMGAPFPLHPRALISLAGHKQREVRHWAVVALSKVNHPAAREFALRSLASRRTVHVGMWALLSNYEEQDAPLVAKALRSVLAPEDFHSVGLDVIEIAERGLRAELAGPLRTVYERTPCSHCRRRAAEALYKFGALPARLVEECLCDCEPMTREFAEKVKTGAM